MTRTETTKIKKSYNNWKTNTRFPIVEECKKSRMSINHFQILVAKYGSASRLLNAVTRSCEETIFFCKLGVGVEIVGELCCKQNFKEPVYTTEGKCFGSAGKMEFRQVLKSQ